MFINDNLNIISIGATCDAGYSFVTAGKTCQIWENGEMISVVEKGTNNLYYFEDKKIERSEMISLDNVWITCYNTQI